MSSFAKLYTLLDASERKYALLILLIIVLKGVVELVGIASVFPLIAVLSNAELIHENVYLSFLFNVLGFSSERSFLLLLSGVSFLFILLRVIVAFISDYLINRYSLGRIHTISVKLLDIYLKKPYVWFLNKNSADLSKTILSEVEQVVRGSLIPAFQLLSLCFTSILIISLLIFMNPVIAIVSLVIVSCAYGVTFVSVRASVHRSGAERLAANRNRFQIAQEVLSGVKEIKVANIVDVYVKSYRRHSSNYAKLFAKVYLIREIPKSVLEVITFGGMLLLVFLLLALNEGNLNKALPLISLYAFAGYRLMPILQALYQNLVSMRYNTMSLGEIHRELIQIAEPLPEQKGLTRCNEEICLDCVTFCYPGSNHRSLDDISVRIPSGSYVGFVGRSGAGKTTLLDILLGLLSPTSGRLLIDGNEIGSSNVGAWQRNIGYVPQNVFLVDDSIAANIALGLEAHLVDMGAVERAARLAQIDDFINELPDGYNTNVGDRGIRLSGGQRQRISVARALYNDPDVLIFDEATSALDARTESSLIEAIEALSSMKTVIQVTHRVSSLKNCDRIYLIEAGSISAFGVFDELRKESDIFRSLES